MTDPSAEPADGQSSQLPDSVWILPKRGVDQPFLKRLRATWRLLPMWTRRETRTRYRQSLLGHSWGILQPIALLVIYGWTVTAVLDVAPSKVPYLVFAWSGVVPFAFLSQALTAGVGSLQMAGSLISRVYFPRDVLPLSAVSATLLDLFVMTLILIVVAWVQVGPPTITLVGLVPVYAMLIIWTSALTLFAATVTVFRRDLNHAVPLLLRALFILSPVVYSAELLQDRAYWLYAINPVAVAIEGTRDATLRGAWPDIPLVGTHLLVGAVLLAGCYWMFRSVEPSMGDYV